MVDHAPPRSVHGHEQSAGLTDRLIVELYTQQPGAKFEQARAVFGK
jgi:hypothetical protein